MESLRPKLREPPGLEVRALFDFVDEDRDGLLSFAEFFQLFAEMRIGLRMDTVLTLFNMFDTDQSGQLNYFEFLQHIFPTEMSEEAQLRMKRQHRQSSKKVCDALARLDAVASPKALDSVAERQEDEPPHNSPTR